MKVLIALFGALAVAQAGLFDQNGIRATFGLDLFSSFNEIPVTCKEAINKKWIAEEVPDYVDLKGLTFYCYPDKKICIFYDDTCYYAGQQIAIKLNNFKNCYLFDDPAVMENRGYRNWTSLVDGIPTDFVTMRFFTIDQALLDTSAANRIAARKSDRILQNGFIDVEGPGGITRIPTSKDEIEKQGIFLKQAFVIMMGQHYYFKMSTSTNCTSEYLFPYFPLTHNGEVVAIGMLTFGEQSFDKGEKVWFESPTESDVKMIVPDGPECLYELVKTCGLTTLHTYFVPHPRTILMNT